MLKQVNIGISIGFDTVINLFQNYNDNTSNNTTFILFEDNALNEPEYECPIDSTNPYSVSLSALPSKSIKVVLFDELSQ